MLPIAGEHRFDAVNRDLLPQLQTNSFRRVEIDGADTRAGVQKKIKRLVRLRDGDFNPQQTFAILKREFGKDGGSGLRLEKCSN